MRAAFIVALVQIMVGLVIWSTPAAFAQPNPRPGSLHLTVLDADSGQPTPARVELLDKQGEAYVARDALPVDGDCELYYGNAPQEDLSGWTLERAVALLKKKSPQPLHWDHPILQRREVSDFLGARDL